MALLRNSVPEARRPRVFGMFGAVMGTAAAVGPLLGGELTARFGWRAVFVANLPVILVAFGLIRFAGPLAPRHRSSAGHDSTSRAAWLLAAGLQRTRGGEPYEGRLGAVDRVRGRRASRGLRCLGTARRRSRGGPADVHASRVRRGNAVVGSRTSRCTRMLFQLPIFFEQVRSVRSGSQPDAPSSA